MTRPLNQKKAYLDASIITVWILTEDQPDKIDRLPLRARKCMELLDYLVKGRLNCRLQTSDWAISEMVQGIRDRVIARKFMLDGYEISSFNRLKFQYTLEDDERKIMSSSINDFVKYLTELEIQFIRLRINWQKVHEYCLKYSLETPDAIHLLIAGRHSDYLITIDRPLKQASITELEILDPGEFLTKGELRFS